MANDALLGQDRPNVGFKPIFVAGLLCKHSRARSKHQKTQVAEDHEDQRADQKPPRLKHGCGEVRERKEISLYVI
jgi:hypothetical protein